MSKKWKDIKHKSSQEKRIKVKERVEKELEKMNQKEIAYQLLGILQEYAPNGIAQEKCTKYYNELVKATTDRDLVLQLVYCLHDGLRYGNWIWMR